MAKRNCVLVACVVLVCGGFVPAGVEADEAGRIRSYDGNRRYWQYQGEPVLLLGGTKDDNLFQVPDLEAHLDLLAACGGNYIRNTLSARDEGNVQPFKRLANGKYDLNQGNPAYWRRLDEMLRLTHERDVIPQIEIWAFHDFNLTTWPENPWRPANNVNYGTDDTTLADGSVNIGHKKHAFFFTVPALNNDTAVLRYQEKFVAKVLSHTLAWDHVLYCITNEIHPQFSPQWGYYWARFIKKKAAERDKRVEVSELLWQTDFRKPQQKESLDRPDIYSYFECSQNSANPGQENGDNMQYVYDSIGRHPRPINHVKIYGADTGPVWAEKTIHAERRFWRNIFGGSASSRFHRPPTGIGLSETAQTHIRSMRILTAELDVFRCEPDIGYRLLKDREEDEAYLLYQENAQYAAFFPRGGAVGLDLTEASGTFKVRWLDIANSAWRSGASVRGGEVVRLQAPSTALWAVLVGR